MWRILLVTLAVASSKVQAPWPILRSVDGYDNTGDGVVAKSFFTDATVRKIYVNPNATKVTLNVACAESQRLYVNGRESTSGDVTIKRNHQVHNQVVEAICYDPKIKKASAPNKQRYVFMISSEYDPSSITMPHLFLNQVGIDCEAGKSALSSSESINCADPKFHDGHVSVTPSNLLSDCEYTLRSSDDEVAIRLLNSIPTPSFPYKKSFKIHVNAGSHSKSWDVSFGGNLLSNVLYGLGCFLGATLFALCTTLLLVVGCSSLMGPGVPFGSSEIASIFALIIQYFTLSNKLRGSSSMESLATPLKWVSLFWPAPVDRTMIFPITSDTVGTDLSNHSRAGPTYARAYGVSFNSDSQWDASMIGDVADLKNAVGCIFWSAILLLLLSMIHVIAIAYMRSGAQEGFTVPHRFAYGNWESRAINLIMFPMAAASILCLAHPEASPITMAIGGFAIISLICWLIHSFYKVGQAVNEGAVSWIWQTSVRESGTNRCIEDDGYWADTECDQLLSIPVNRAICGKLFEYKWINTVGDIRPIPITTTAGEDDHSSSGGSSIFSSVVRPVGKMTKSSHKAGGYLLAKNPLVVHVDQGRKPCPGFMNGSRLMAGVLRTKWLDIMFTMEGLTKFLSYEQIGASDAPYTPIPLLVKTAQLSGPITQGAYAFFFDGVRVPFARIAESVWKVTIGFCLGAAAAFSLRDPESSVPGSFYALVATLSCCQFAYVLATRPYTRKLDTFVVAAVAAIVACSAGAMTRYAYNHRTKLADGFLATSVACAFALSFYAIFLIISIFTAVCCPPLDESVFLEKLANCSVFIAPPDAEFERPESSLGSVTSTSLRGGRGTLRPGNEYELPGWSKYAAKDIIAKSTTGRAKLHKFGTFEDLDLHFDHAEIAQSCSTGILPIP